MAYSPKWLPPGKILERYVIGSAGVRDEHDAAYQLYCAVRDGEVRARHQKKLLAGAELNQIFQRKWAKHEQYELPADIELSVEDALRIWDDEGDLSVRIASGELSGRALENLVDQKLASLEFGVHRVEIKHAGDEQEAKSAWKKEAGARDALVSDIRIGLAHIHIADVRKSFTERFGGLVSRIRTLDKDLVGASRRATTILGEKQCQAWLVDQMNKGAPAKIKDQYFEEAEKKFAIGRQGFNRAWKEAITETGNERWSKPGRKSLRHADTI